MIRAFVLASIFVSISSSALCAKEWARGMFEKLEHDFGTVARGAEVSYDFTLQNKFEEDVHIASVTTSCKCTTPSIVKADLKTWEKGAVRAVFNTRAFLGARTATVTVIIDKPYYAEVQLVVKGYVRRDIIFEPGAVEFGSLQSGQGANKLLRVKYAGRPDWKITDVKGPGYYEIRLAENQRENGRVGYDMQVRLKPNAPAGYFSDQLIVETNDQKLRRVPLVVKGRVIDKLVVSPASLSLGVLRPGQKATKQLVVRAKEPFRVIRVACEKGDDCFSFQMPSEAKKVHLIPVTFTAGDHATTIAQKISIKTDLGNGAVASCFATATVKESSGDVE